MSTKISQICQGPQYHRVPNNFVETLDLWRTQGIPWQEVNEKIARMDAENEPIYDKIDEDIYQCFIEGASWCFNETLTEEELKLDETTQEAIYYQRREKVIAEIAQICSEHDGKLFKSKAKNAKCAIIGAIGYWSYSRVEELHSQGYKVTNWTSAIRYFKLEDFWKCENQDRAYLDQTAFKKSPEYKQTTDLTINTMFQYTKEHSINSRQETKKSKKGIFGKIFGG